MRKSAEPPKLDLPRPKRVVNWRGQVKPGRKPTRPGVWVEHRERPPHDHRDAVYVTVPVKKDVPALTSRKASAAIVAGLELAATANWERQKQRRRTFRVIHYAIRADRLELIVEASSTGALSRGMQGLSSGIARRVNNQIGRVGSLFKDRYDARDLSTASDVKKVIAFLEAGGPDLPLVSEPKTRHLLALVRKRR
jgi:hypothetical protein